MNDINARLRAGDPVSQEPGLTADEFAAMRRAVLIAADAAPRTSVLASRQFALAACLALMVLTGLVAAHRVPQAGTAPAPSPTPASTQRTQVQFSTPGGTRIVWTLDPGFQLGETRR